MKWVVFDVGGVLYTQCPKSKDSNNNPKWISKICKNNGHYNLVKNLHSKHKHDLTKGKLTTKDFCKIISNYTKINDEHIYDIIYSWKKNKILKHDLDDLFILLQRKNIKSAICSNVDIMSHRIRHEVGLYDNIDGPVIVSCNIGMRKPEEEIFHYLIKKLKCKPEEILFLDDKKSNTDMAESLGINIILVENESQLKLELYNYLKNL